MSTPGHIPFTPHSCFHLPGPLKMGNDWRLKETYLSQRSHSDEATCTCGSWWNIASDRLTVYELELTIYNNLSQETHPHLWPPVYIWPLKCLLSVYRRARLSFTYPTWATRLPRRRWSETDELTRSYYKSHFMDPVAPCGFHVEFQLLESEIRTIWKICSKRFTPALLCVCVC